MSNFYEYDFRLNGLDVDGRNQCKASALLNHLQNAATLAADLLEESGVENIGPEALQGGGGLMVTTQDIDRQVRDLSKVVGYGINWALQDLEIEEMNALLS